MAWLIRLKEIPTFNSIVDRLSDREDIIGLVGEEVFQFYSRSTLGGGEDNGC